MKNIRILILDDEVDFRQEIREFLESHNYMVHEAGNPADAFRILEQNQIDIVFLNIRLLQMSGLHILEEVKRTYPTLEVILISGHGDMNRVIEALRNGAGDFLKKPFQTREVSATIEKSSKYVHQTLNRNLAKHEISFSQEY